MTLGVERLGSRAIVVRVGAAAVESVRRSFDERPLPGQREVVAGGDSVVILLRSAGDVAAATAEARERRPSPVDDESLDPVEVDVVYDGDDLAVVATMLGLDPDGVVRAHSQQTWRVAFMGFAPGFGYLEGDGRALAVPRRDSPRTVVPAGSVALAGGFSAVYPRSSPGGWQLIGRTDAILWDPGVSPPSPLAPGRPVRFRPVRETAEAAPPARPSLPRSIERGFIAERIGLQALVEDLGRQGSGAWGVSRSGAADRGSLRRVQRLVGNPAAEAAIEIVGPSAWRAVGAQVVAVTGARVAVRVSARDPGGDHDGVSDHSGTARDEAMDRAFLVGDGEVVETGYPDSGLRAYLAVRGGFALPGVLGSRATDTLGALGVPPLSAGDALPVGPAPRDAVGAADPTPDLPRVGGAAVALEVILGPDNSWFDDTARGALLETEWTVSAQTDRVAARLDGPPIVRRPGELASRGLVPGAIQIPPSGQPVLFLADHPATGGYPVIAVVADSSLDLAGQLAPGARVRFCPVRSDASEEPRARTR